MATVMSSVNHESTWEARLLVRSSPSQEHLERKFLIHRKLLDKINLEKLSSIQGDRMRAEFRAAVASLVEEEKTPLSLVEKEQLVEEVLDEVFGLGPLEPLLRDPAISDILVNTYNSVFIVSRRGLAPPGGGGRRRSHLLRNRLSV